MKLEFEPFVATKECFNLLRCNKYLKRKDWILCYGKVFRHALQFFYEKNKTQKERIEEMNGHVNAKFQNSNIGASYVVRAVVVPARVRGQIRIVIYFFLRFLLMVAQIFRVTGGRTDTCAG